MSSNHRVAINDEIEVTGYRPARLPPPSNNSQPQTAILISSDDEVDAPAAKRVKTTAQPSTSYSETARAKRKEYKPPHIDLTCCEDIIEDTIMQRPRKRVKRSKPPESNKSNPIFVLDSDEELFPIHQEPLPSDEPESDSDYENIHHGYMIGWSTSTIAPDENTFDDTVSGLAAAVARLSLDQLDTGSIYDSCRLAPVPPLEAAMSSQEAGLAYQGAFSFLPSSKLHHSPLHLSYSGSRSRTGLLWHSQSQLQYPLTSLKLTTQFQMADACHSISQSSEKIILASSTPGGTTDDDDTGGSFIVDPYNSRDTLAIWCEDNQKHWLQAHFVNSNDPGMAGGRFQQKYYDIKKAQFDPSDSSIFASTGLDGTLAVWNSQLPSMKPRQSPTTAFEESLQEDTRAIYVPVKKWGKETFDAHSCHDIVYRQQNSSCTPSIFAAPCDNGAIFIHSYAPTCDLFTVRRLQVTRHAIHQAGATVWGRGPTTNALFVCSEGEGESDTVHAAFDFETGRVLYYFDDHDSGEELVLSPKGDLLALFTAPEGGLRMRLYDVARGNNHCTATAALPPASLQLRSDISPEVRTASWSPDGILLAVGGNDDVAHVYDVRCLGRGPVLSMTHQTRSSRGLPLTSLPPEARSEIKNSFGITVLSWTLGDCFRSPSLALMTGGGDHCIALWDVKTACKTRQVLAELDGHVGVAHFGNAYNGEKPLVAGDTDGHIYIYDFVQKDNSREK